MTTDPMNPFGFPGFQQSMGADQGNPLASSLEMMKNTMQSFGTAAMMAGDSMKQTANSEELERRISDLKTVQSWLQLNLSMVGSSIQAMEVQLATIRTLQSFIAMGAGQGASDAQPSPLEVVLGLKSAPEVAASPQPASTDSSDASAEMPGPDLSAAAAQAWWDMLQNQFVQMASATSQMAASAQDVSDQPEPEKTAKKASSKKTATKAAKKSSAKKAAAKSSPRKMMPKD